MLPAHTTLTIFANALGATQITGQCPQGSGQARDMCDYAGAFASIQLDYVDPESQISTTHYDLLENRLYTTNIGEGAQWAGGRQLSVSLTNNTDEALRTAFNFRVEASGQSAPTIVPEPSTWALWCLGLLGLAGASRRARLQPG